MSNVHLMSQTRTSIDNASDHTLKDFWIKENEDTLSEEWMGRQDSKSLEPSSQKGIPQKKRSAHKSGSDCQRNKRARACERRSKTGTKKNRWQEPRGKCESSRFRPKTQTTPRCSPMLEKNRNMGTRRHVQQ